MSLQNNLENEFVFSELTPEEFQKGLFNILAKRNEKIHILKKKKKLLKRQYSILKEDYVELQEKLKLLTTK